MTPTGLGDRPPADMGEQWERARAEVRSVGAAIGDISDELRVLLVREGELAHAEVTESTSAARRAAVWGGVGVALGLVAVLFVGMTAMYAIALVWPLWASALTTAVVLVVLAVGCALLARQQLRDVHLVPDRTLRSLKEDVIWAREQMKRNAA